MAGAAPCSGSANGVDPQSASCASGRRSAACRDGSGTRSTSCSAARRNRVTARTTLRSVPRPPSREDASGLRSVVLRLLQPMLLFHDLVPGLSGVAVLSRVIAGSLEPCAAFEFLFEQDVLARERPLEDTQFLLRSNPTILFRQPIVLSDS
jgi:hypothetical protein